MPDVELKLGTQRHGGWTSIRVQRSMEHLASAFALELVDTRSFSAPIDEGQPCSLLIDGKLAISGYVDEAIPSYEGDTYKTSVTGRSRAGDLIDCSAVHSPGQWSGRTLKQLATQLCDPYGIYVRAVAGGDHEVPSFALESGETVFDALDRLCRMAGVLLTSNAEGDVVITRAGAKRTATTIELGVNVKSGARRASQKERFSKIIVKGQPWLGEAIEPAVRSARDPSVKRLRELIIVAEQGASETDLEQRAQWEVNVRSGRARRVTYTVPSWSNAEGLWAPNVLAHVKDKRFGLDEELLIVSATLVLDDQGERTDLELTRKAAFDVKPLPPEKTWGLW